MNIAKIKEELISRNNNLKNTLIDEFLTEKYLKLFPLFVVEECANYQKVQKIIMKLSDTQLDILSKVINKAIKDNHDWVSVASKLIRSIDYKVYANLFNDLEGKNLSDKDIEKLLFFTENSRNFYAINSFADLNNSEFIKGEVINKNCYTKDPNILLLCKYGMSYDKAYAYFKRYGADLLKLPESKEKVFLKDIKNILEGKNTDTLIFNDYDFINNIDSNLRNMFVKIYNEKLFKITEESKFGNYHVFDTNIEIYDAGVSFTLCIYSLGLSNDSEAPENYFEDWNRPNARIANFCNSIVTEKSIKTKIKHCVYGFDNFGLNDIKLSAPNDLGTNGEINDNPDVTYIDREKLLIADVVFRIPEEIINNTRYTNNEIYRSRRIVADNKLKKINPSYIVYFKQYSDMNIESDRIWQESVKASLDFSQNGKPLPIVIVDCEKCLINNIKNIENLLVKFENTYDNPKMIIQIVEYVQTILSGYRNNMELINEYLPSEKVFSYFDRLLNHINKISDIVPTIALSAINNFIKSFDVEYDKILASEYWVRKSNNGSLIEKNPKIYDILNNTKAEILKNIAEKEITEIMEENIKV